VIFVSAGHHPAAPGATFERFIEHDEAVIWQHLMCEKLCKNCLEVPPGTLRKKVDFINSRLINGDIAIEIHFNSAVVNGQHVGNGCEVLYYPGSVKGEHIATLCQEALALVFPPSRGVKEGWYRMDPKRGADFFLARTKCPAIILEPEFVHHAEIIMDNREMAIGLMIDNLKEYIDDNGDDAG